MSFSERFGKGVCMRGVLYGLIVCNGLTGAGRPLRAQEQLTLTLPTIPMAAAGVSTRPITAGEAVAHTVAKEQENLNKLSFRSAQYPIDSMRAAVTATSIRWLAQVQQHPVVGMHVDPSGRVGVAANQEAYAKQQIATRLATPGLSFGDRAYTLRTAVIAFSSIYAPERLPTAESYLKALDALGDSAAAWQFEARKHLLWTYYLLGRSTDVARLGTRAVELVGVMPFANRNLMFGQTDEQVYSPTVEALAGQVDGRRQIDQLNATLRAATVPSPALLASDQAYRYYGEITQQAAERYISGNAKVGTPAAPLVAQHWLNRPSRDSATVPLNDGTIRIIEVAHTGCVPCVHALAALGRLQQQFSTVEPLLFTWTFGFWGNRLVEPDEEVARLTSYFLNDVKVTFPIGIWAGQKVPDPDGGMVPEAALNINDYPLLGKPMLWIVDGKGIIRRVFTGYDRNIETQMARTIEFLVREHARPVSAGIL